jgi:predicted ATPase/class 3 adenylate cyclase
LPDGLVTTLFTDIEGSTRLVRMLGTEAYRDQLELHRELLRHAFAFHRGHVVEMQGDSFHVAFPRPSDAVAAAGELQRGLEAVEWPYGEPIRVRVGLHTGEPMPTGDLYVGLDIHLAARVMAAAHGGQVLLSEPTAALVRGSSPLRDLGWHRLKDFPEPLRLFQLGEDDFPPLRTLHKNNLPSRPTRLIGRQAEVRDVRRLISDGARLVTLTGPGGSGKTRLALEAAAQLEREFANGVAWVSLAPIAEVKRVAPAISSALELPAQASLFEAVSGQRVLLVLDNAEHLPGLPEQVAELLTAAPDLVVLATSRTPLHLRAEQLLPVQPLGLEPAAELLVERAAAVGRTLRADETIEEICRRLDGLPLALELAAGRMTLLSPKAFLERLDQAMPLLTGGPRDAPARQQTLRATIEWSVGLLPEDTQTVFRRLGVFRGSFAVAAADAIAEAALDTLQTLVDHGLARRVGDERLLIHETIRQWAVEELERRAELTEARVRHGRYYTEWACSTRNDLKAREALYQTYLLEEGNMWAALDAIFDLGEHDLAFAAADRLENYWLNFSPQAGRAWLATALAASDNESPQRAAALSSCAVHALLCGDLADSRRLAEQLHQLAQSLGDELALADAEIALARVALSSGDLPRAIELFEQAYARRQPLVEPALSARTKTWIAYCLIDDGQLDKAEAYLLEVLPVLRASGNRFTNAGQVLSALEMVYIRRRDFARAESYGAAALEDMRDHRGDLEFAAALGYHAIAALGVGDNAAALVRVHEAVDRAQEVGMPTLVQDQTAIAAAALATDAPAIAVRLWSATETERTRRGQALEALYGDEIAPRIAALEQTLGSETFARERAAGETLTLNEAAALALAATARLARAGQDEVVER